MRICTIVARNYLGHAEVLAESFREHHPSGEVTVLVVDDRERLVASSSGRYDADATLVRDPGMNVAYRNLHEHDLRVDADGRRLVDNAPAQVLPLQRVRPAQSGRAQQAPDSFAVERVPAVTDLEAQLMASRGRAHV